MTRVYCYTDENGSETAGRVFIVANIVLQGEHDELYTFCEQAEQVSGKGKFKWGKAKHEQRLDYIRRIFAEPRFRGRIRYSIFEDRKDYDVATVNAISRALLLEHTSQKDKVTVRVDALSKTKRREYAQMLRTIGILVRDVRGITKDETNAITRLADAVAGLVRDVHDQPNSEIADLFEVAKRKKIIIEV